MKVYTTSNGLLGDQFNYRSSFETEDGTIYLGSIDGFVAFNPKTFSENKSLPSVVLTDFLLFGKEVYVGDPGSPLEKSITFSDEIVLRANQNSFSFRVAALDFQAPKMSKIMYKLDGFDTDWLTVGESPIVKMCIRDSPSTINYLNKNTFVGCDKLANVYCNRVIPPVIENNETCFSNYDCLYVPKGSVGFYQGEEGWNKFKSIKDFEFQ